MNQQKEQLEEIFSYYNSIRKPVQQEDVVNMLREIQELYGFISPEMKQRVADTLEIKESVLTCLIKRFPGLKEADYQHVVTVCSGERCGKKNGNKILQAVHRHE